MICQRQMKYCVLAQLPLQHHRQTYRSVETISVLVFPGVLFPKPGNANANNIPDVCWPLASLDDQLLPQRDTILEQDRCEFSLAIQPGALQAVAIHAMAGTAACEPNEVLTASYR